MSSVLERNIQIEVYRILQNLVASKFTFNDIEFTGVRFEPTINGRPDLVVEAIDKGKKLSLLVIETKRKVPFVDRKFDSYSKDVIKQASGYAVDTKEGLLRLWTSEIKEKKECNFLEARLLLLFRSESFSAPLHYAWFSIVDG